MKLLPMAIFIMIIQTNFLGVRRAKELLPVSFIILALEYNYDFIDNEYKSVTKLSKYSKDQLSKSKASAQGISKYSKDKSSIRDGSPTSENKSNIEMHLSKNSAEKNLHLMRSINKSPMVNSKISQKLSQNILNHDPNFDHSDASEYHDQVRNSNE